jgi:hypothetical protein
MHETVLVLVEEEEQAGTEVHWVVVHSKLHPE